jgi:ABC-2 type transport system ATP-binding protein
MHDQITNQSVALVGSTPLVLESPHENTVINATELSKQFKDSYAVRSVSFYVPEGSIFGFIGPSGSGKTTTIRLLTGVYRPTGGIVTVLGKYPAQFSKSDREKIGYLPQQFVLYPNLTVWENMNFAASLYGVGIRGRKNLKSLLEFVELADDKGKLASQLSGGMQRRLSLATTLIHNPDLIFMDEPTAGIDPILRSKFWSHFNEMKQGGRTLFITTQYVSEAAYCDIVGIMAQGELVAVGTPEGLRKRAMGGDLVVLRSPEWISHDTQLQINALPFVKEHVRRTSDNEVVITVEEASTAIPQLIDWANQNKIQIESIEESMPNFDEIFIKVIEAYQNE